MPSVWIVERQIGDDEWTPLWHLGASGMREVAEQSMARYLALGVSGSMRVWEYAPVLEEPPSAARACDGVPRWAAS